MSATHGRSAPHYLLGHDPHELARLDLQGVIYGPITLRALREAGVGPGMRVLDLGCGTGDVTLTVAELVGPEGTAVGIDRSPHGIEAARAHARDRGLMHAEFVVGEIEDLADREAFDALVGRFVLMHQPDPARALRAASRALRPEAVVVMIESHMEQIRTGSHSFPRCPLYERIVEWKSRVVGGAGADLEAGLRLRRTFVDAGLPAPTLRLEARVEGGADSAYYRYVAESVRSMLPEARRSGIDGFTEADVSTLAERLRDEVVAVDGVLVVWPVVTAWTRLRPGR